VDATGVCVFVFFERGGKQLIIVGFFFFFFHLFVIA
jgi:hypothetical protein